MIRKICVIIQRRRRQRHRLVCVWVSIQRHLTLHDLWLFDALSKMERGLVGQDHWSRWRVEGKVRSLWRQYGWGHWSHWSHRRHRSHWSHRSHAREWSICGRGGLAGTSIPAQKKHKNTTDDHTKANSPSDASNNDCCIRI